MGWEESFFKTIMGWTSEHNTDWVYLYTITLPLSERHLQNLRGRYPPAGLSTHLGGPRWRPKGCYSSRIELRAKSYISWKILESNSDLHSHIHHCHLSHVPKSKWETWHWITVLSVCWTVGDPRNNIWDFCPDEFNVRGISILPLYLILAQVPKPLVEGPSLEEETIHEWENNGLRIL